MGVYDRFPPYWWNWYQDQYKRVFLNPPYKNDLKIMERMNAEADRIITEALRREAECLWYTPITKVTMAKYRVYNESNASPCSAWTTEADAVSEAERLAKMNPGTEYTVYKVVTKSVAQKPVTTTRF